ncbi:MAG: TetR family transcriptional regulator [Marinosulfonomonas sp.]
MSKSVLGNQTRERNPKATRRDILIAAREEFVEYGLDGARVDRIAARAKANKRLLYHYVGNKEALYAQVLLDAYKDIRKGEAKLQLEEKTPTEAMAHLVGFTFDHFRANPWFIRLLSTENIHRAHYAKSLDALRDLNSPIIGWIREILAKGVETGEFRKGVDPLQLYVSVAGLSYFYFSNIHTLSVAFQAPLDSEEMLLERRRLAIEMVLSFLKSEFVLS